MNNPQSDRPEIADPQSTADEALRQSRRRLLRGGLSVAPVLLTVASRPVMASTGACAPASSYASLNASRPNKVDYCTGRKPYYWKQSDTRWPAPYVPSGSGATLFDAVFGAQGGYPDLTLRQVLMLDSSSYGRDALARHVVAALLNAAAGLTPQKVLGTSTVKEVWRSFATKGYYEPTAGVWWYADYSEPAGAGGITPWIQSTMTS